MPLDRLSALRRALVPRIGLGLAFTSRTVHSLQHLTSPDSLDIRRRQNPLMPAVPALTVTHPSALRPAAANLSHDVVLGKVHDPHDQRHRPGEQDQILTQCNPKKHQDKGQPEANPPGNQTRPHDHSTLDNDSPDHPGRASPHSLPSPHPDSSEIREALLGHLGVRARAAQSPNKRGKHADTSGIPGLPCDCVSCCFRVSDTLKFERAILHGSRIFQLIRFHIYRDSGTVKIGYQTIQILSFASKLRVDNPCVCVFANFSSPITSKFTAKP